MKNIDFLHKELTEKIIEASLDVMRELGSGFLESVYEKSTLIALSQKAYLHAHKSRSRLCFVVRL